MIRPKLIDSILLIAIAASAVLALIALLGPGVYTSAYGIRLSSQTLWRPAVVAIVASALLLYRSELRQQKLATIWSRVLPHAAAVAILLAVATFIVAIRVSPFEAYRADAYGYVSQAHLWAAGNLVQYEPLSVEVPWPEPEWTFSPFGYRPGPARGTIVPTYAPGLPLLMAGLLVLFGSDGPFLAVPLLGGVAVFIAFLLGRRVAGEACGLATAGLLLTSPIFFLQLKEPMSDVPVTAWWLLAILMVLRTAPAFLFAGGLATSAAILTRPNLVPLAAVLGTFVLLYSAQQLRTRLFNACIFSSGVIPGCLGVAIFNDKLYGSPLSSGYGDMSVLFDVKYFWTNLSQYSEWLVDTETPFILLAIAGLVLLWRRERIDHGGMPALAKHRLSYLFVGFAAALYGCYAVYLPFDNWTFLRFLLPAIALLLLLCSLSMLHLSTRLPSFFSRFILVACFVGFLAWRWDLNDVRLLRPHERRNVVIGEYVRDHLPPNAIVFSMLQAGSIRFYSGRLTLRWDWLPDDWLDRSVTFLTAHGYSPFLLIEAEERTQFVQKFSGQSKIGSLNITPVATYQGNADARADLYDLGNPNRVTNTAAIGPRLSRP